LYVLLLSGLFVYLDTNPLTPSDGSHMLEALLDDELARASALSRRRAALSTRPVVNTYRLVCVVHFLVAVLIVGWLVVCVMGVVVDRVAWPVVAGVRLA